MKYQPVDKWKFNDEEVTLESWMWVATYEDGTEFLQYDSRGIFHQINEIDFDKLVRFTMIKTDNTDLQHSMVIGPNMKPFFFIRRGIFKHTQPDEERLAAYVFGYQDRETGRQMYHFILPDDRLVITEDRSFSPFKIN